MLNNLSEQVRECHRHAEHCAWQAGVQIDPKLERRWLMLARSCEFTQRLADFSDETKRLVDKLPKSV